MKVLRRIAEALEELVHLHQSQEARLARLDAQRVTSEREQFEQNALHIRQMNEALATQARNAATQEAIREDNLKHLAKCERRYLARLAGEEVSEDEVRH